MTTSIDKNKECDKIEAMKDLKLLRRMLIVLHWEFNMKTPPVSISRDEFVKYYAENKGENECIPLAYAVPSAILFEILLLS